MPCPRDNINPDREHHVGFLIDNHNHNGNDRHRHRLHLRFSFFTSTQPYDELDAGQARDSFGARGADTERVLLVSYFNYRVTILCDAGENRQR